MEKVLNQEEIDAMVRAARGGEGKAKEAAVVRWDARQAGVIGRGQVQQITALHEDFARNLTYSLAAYLRIVFTAALASAEHLTFGEFLQRVPEVTYLATCKLAPVGASALLQLDLAVAFPLIDVLLGGEGKSAPPERQITEIEEQILATVILIICRELQAVWQVLPLQFSFEERRQPDQVQHLFPAEEKTLSLSFEITVADNRGTLNVVLPAVVSSALLRKMSADWARSKRRAQPEAGERLRRLLLDCPFSMELGVRIPAVPVRELVRMAPGKLLVLDCPAQQPAALRVGERELFTSLVARRSTARAAQVLERCRTDVEKRKEPSG